LFNEFTCPLPEIGSCIVFHLEAALKMECEAFAIKWLSLMLGDLKDKQLI
jgi:hypothetical protein